MQDFVSLVQLLSVAEDLVLVDVPHWGNLEFRFIDGNFMGSLLVDWVILKNQWLINLRLFLITYGGQKCLSLGLILHGSQLTRL